MKRREETLKLGAVGLIYGSLPWRGENVRLKQFQRDIGKYTDIFKMCNKNLKNFCFRKPFFLKYLRFSWAKLVNFMSVIIPMLLKNKG